ncbi:MAG: hypothetical protein NTW86_00705, partial [Candidatus Sumerlaeota bacterium]|nr:hypothetical protein [Candidatus Sumerlaeota bacterium]
MTRPFCPAMFWMILAVGSAMCLAAFSQGGNAGPAPNPSEPAARDVFQATFDGPEGQDLANMGRAKGRVAIETGAGNPGAALQLSGSAGLELATPIPTR